MRTTRRQFLEKTAAAAALAGVARGAGKRIPVGLELYSVRESLKRDLFGTLDQVAAIGYEVVEFYSPYFEWTDDYAKQVRRRLDDLGMECRSMHSPMRAFEPANRARAIELHSIVGSRSVVMASPGHRETTVDAWKETAELLSGAQEVFAAAGMEAGYHNHASEWRALDGDSAGRHAMDVLAAETPEGVTLQLDVGTCVEMGKDPVAWIEKHPGRIRSIHCKDWAPGEEADEKGFRVLVGEGASPWKEIRAAAETVGGVEFYLIEQEGSRFSEMETAERCLEWWRGRS